MIQQFCVGLVFDEPRQNLLLIEKIKPDYLKGKLNGVGGKVEPWETSAQAMVRELQEETGLVITSHQHLSRFLLLEAVRGEQLSMISFYDIVLPTDLWRTAKQMEEEKLVRMPVGMIEHPEAPALVPNLYWIIPYLLNPFRHPKHLIYVKEVWPLKHES